MFFVCSFETKAKSCFMSLSVFRKIIVGLIVVFPLLAHAQLVKETFTVLALDDQFDEDNGHWRRISSPDNLFITQDGQYLLHRRNTVSAYSIFTSWENTLSDFSLKTSMKLDQL